MKICSMKVSKLISIMIVIIVESYTLSNNYESKYKTYKIIKTNIVIFNIILNVF